ncbi:MAG: TolC family protein [Azoarcus sp.]|jgi:outer membrane protein TolC|nr:TolC family protein [Azoarcus sp.]
MNPNCMAGLMAGLICLAHGEATALSLDEALSRTAHAPEILSSLASEAAAEELSKAAGQLPDPRIVLSVDDFMLEGDMQYRFDGSKRMVGVMQAIPAASRRQAERQKAAAAYAGSARAREYTQLAARREVSLLWLKLYFLTQKAALLQASADEIRRRQAATTSMLAGGGEAGMALEALFDRQKLDDAFDLLRRDFQLVRARLTRWIGPLALAETATGALPAWARNTSVILPGTANVPEADTETELRASRSRIDIAEAELLLALADRDMNWNMEVGFGQDAMGKSMMMAKVGVSLPIFAGTRQNPRIAAARARLTGVEAEHTLRKAEFARQREELLAEETALSAMLLRLAQETLPLLDRGAALAEAAFSGGKGSAAALIQAREKQLAARMRAVDLEAERAATRARLYFLHRRSGEIYHDE